MQEQQNLRNKLTCTVTGKVVSVAPKVFDQRATKYGSQENLRLNYISALGRKLLCAGKTVDQVRVEFNVDSSVPVPAATYVEKYTKWAKYRNKQDTKDTPTINEQAST